MLLLLDVWYSNSLFFRLGSLIVNILVAAIGRPGIKGWYMLLGRISKNVPFQ